LVKDHPTAGAPVRLRELDIEQLPKGVITRVHIELVGDGLASDVLVPVLVARGSRDGPVFGITAAVHGNELNGIRAIHSLFQGIEVHALRGTLVGVLAVNVPGLHNHQREFIDGRDLNHLFPGDSHGDVARVYAFRVIERIVSHFDYLVDLHTASFGRINSLYVRADMTDPKCARMAYLHRPQIIVHNPASDKTLRGTAMELGIPAVTVEIGDPQRFQPRYIKSTRTGLRSVLADARMLPRRALAQKAEPVICQRSYWLYTDRGGLLEVLPDATEMVDKGQPVARLRNAFGDVIREYGAPEQGIVVGKSVNPVGQTGARILHLGVVAPSDHGYLRREPLASRPGLGPPSDAG
jgi:predicted deacylase